MQPGQFNCARIDYGEQQLFHERIHAPSAGAVTDRTAITAMFAIAGVIRDAGVVTDPHTPPAVLAVDDALQQAQSAAWRARMR